MPRLRKKSLEKRKREDKERRRLKKLEESDVMVCEEVGTSQKKPARVRNPGHGEPGENDRGAGPCLVNQGATFHRRGAGPYLVNKGTNGIDQLAFTDINTNKITHSSTNEMASSGTSGLSQDNQCNINSTHVVTELNQGN